LFGRTGDHSKHKIRKEKGLLRSRKEEIRKQVKGVTKEVIHKQRLRGARHCTDDIPGREHPNASRCATIVGRFQPRMALIKKEVEPEPKTLLPEDNS